MPMWDTLSPAETIIGVARRRRFTTKQKLAVVAETMQAERSICRHCATPRAFPEPGVPVA